jgi:hypothetical protein
MKTEIQKTELYQQFKKALGINDMRTLTLLNAVR